MSDRQPGVERPEHPPEPASNHTWPEHLWELASDQVRPPIVLVPGLDGTALLFYRQLPLLAREFDVVAFPLPDDPRITMEGLVDDLLYLIAEVSDHGAILVGESFGGALAMSTALADPGAVRGLVVVNSFPWLDQRLRIRLAPYLLRMIPWVAMPAVRLFTESRLHSSHAHDDDLAEFHERSREIGRQGYIRRLQIVADYDIRDDLGSLRPPTLFIGADEDRLVPSVRWARYMGERVPHSEVTILEGYGHICLINHDLDLLDHIAPWWSSVSGAVSPPRGRPTSRS